MVRRFGPWVFLFGLFSCAHVERPGFTDKLARRWDFLSQHYLERSFARDPGFAATQGRHERDGQIIDLSRGAISAWGIELSSFRSEASAPVFEGLDEARRFERDVMIANIESSQFWSGQLREHTRNPLMYVNALDPGIYLSRDYAPLPVRLSAYVKHTRNMLGVVTAMKENLRLPLPRAFIEVAMQILAGMVPYIEQDVPRVFASVNDRAAQQALASANETAVSVVRRAMNFLAQQRTAATDDFALGPERFAQMLRATEGIETPLATLRDIALRDLERNTTALRAACDALQAGITLDACAANVRNDKPSAGSLSEARAQVAQLAQFTRERAFVSIPSEQGVTIEETPPHKRWNQAFIEIPGPFEKDLPSTYYITPPDAAWTPEEQREYVPGRFDLMFVTAHEVFPGHFLQFLHANRAARPLSRVFVGYAFVEGWAHYAEELVLEQGFLHDEPRARVGQLLNALLRDVRFVCALGLHTSGMTVDEAERQFREHAFTDAGTARQQAARGTFDPGYLSYTLGKLMLRKLRDDWLATHGGHDALPAFHDRLLSFGGPPLALLRKAMLGTREGLF